MKLKFWKREKKTPIVEMKSLNYDTTNYNDYEVANDVLKFPCAGVLKSNKPCTRTVKRPIIYCWQHRR